MQRAEHIDQAARFQSVLERASLKVGVASLSAHLFSVVHIDVMAGDVEVAQEHDRFAFLLADDADELSERLVPGDADVKPFEGVTGIDVVDVYDGQAGILDHYEATFIVAYRVVDFALNHINGQAREGSCARVAQSGGT